MPVLIPLLASLALLVMMGKGVAPSQIQQIKTTKIDTQVIQTERAIYEAVCRYITLKSSNPTSINDLITEGLFQSASNNNGFGGTFSISIDSTKGTLTVTTDIADSTVRTAYINSYKNTFKPIQGTGNYVDTTFVLPTSVMHGNGQFMTGIPVQSTAPSASSNKFWYDTSGVYAVLKMSDGTNWKSVSGGSVTSSTNIGTVLSSSSALTEGTSGDIKYAYDSATNTIKQYAYYNGGYYALNSPNSSSNYYVTGAVCDDNNPLTFDDLIQSNGTCKGMSSSLVADIYSGAGSSYPSGFTVFNNKMYFKATTPTFGTELFVYDGVNPPSLVADIYSGTGSSSPNSLTVFNNKLYFSADNGASGAELFVYDGVNPPSLVADIYSGSSSSAPSNLIVFNNKLYFKASTASIGAGLFVYDGVNPPSLVVNLQTGKGTVAFIVFNNKLYFRANNGASGAELFVYDGVNPPSLVADIYSGTGSSAPSNLIVFNNKLYFSADNGTTGYELFSFGY